MKKWLILLMMLSVNIYAEEKIYANAHEMLVSAIKERKMTGVLKGAIAEHFDRAFHKIGPLFIQARVIKDLVQRDCKRIELMLIKSAFDEKRTLMDFKLKIEMNYCLDGSPPQVIA